jgi:pyruvate kinase
MNRRTKIVCTLGPATWSPERIASLIEAGMDVARINFSHGTQERHAETIRNVREASRNAGRPIAVLGDLQGPKIRVGVLPEPVELTPGDAVHFAPEGEHDPRGSSPPPTRSSRATWRWATWCCWRTG